MTISSEILQSLILGPKLIKEGGDPVEHVCYSDNGEFIVALHASSISILKGSSGELINTFSASNRLFLKSFFGPNSSSQLAALDSKSNSALLWDLENNRIVRQFSVAEQPVLDIFTSDNFVIAAGVRGFALYDPRVELPAIVHTVGEPQRRLVDSKAGLIASSSGTLQAIRAALKPHNKTLESLVSIFRERNSGNTADVSQVNYIDEQNINSQRNSVYQESSTELLEDNEEQADDVNESPEMHDNLHVNFADVAIASGLISLTNEKENNNIEKNRYLGKYLMRQKVKSNNVMFNPMNFAAEYPQGNFESGLTLAQVEWLYTLAQGGTEEPLKSVADFEKGMKELSQSLLLIVPLIDSMRPYCPPSSLASRRLRDKNSGLLLRNPQAIHVASGELNLAYVAKDKLYELDLRTNMTSYIHLPGPLSKAFRISEYMLVLETPAKLWQYDLLHDDLSEICNVTSIADTIVDTITTSSCGEYIFRGKNIYSTQVPGWTITLPDSVLSVTSSSARRCYVAYTNKGPHFLTTPLW